jgi:hypothetical protein
MAEAKRLFDDGAVAFGSGNYDEAIRLWEQSYAISQAPLIRYNIANAWEKLGDFRKTRENLAVWRAAAPPEEQGMLDKRLQNLDARIAREDEAARKAADDKAAREAAERAAAAAAQAKSWLPGVIVGSVGVAAVIAGVTVDGVAASKRPPSSLCMKSSSGQTLCQVAAESGITTSNRMAIAGDVTWIVGAAAVAAGVVLVIVKRSRPASDAAPPPAAAPPPPAAWLVPAPGGLMLGGSF